MRYSVRLFVFLALSFFFFSCEKEIEGGLLPYQDKDVDLCGNCEIRFYSVDTGTKVGKISYVPSNINVIMTQDDEGVYVDDFEVVKAANPEPEDPMDPVDTTAAVVTETAVWGTTSQVFSKNSSGKYVHNPALYWPATEPMGGYHFYASNADLNFSSEGVFVDVNGITDDIICAYNPFPMFCSEVPLDFVHILSIVGTVSLSGFSGCSDINVNLEYIDSGSYNLNLGEWTNLGSTISKTLTVSNSSNNLWVIPGEYAVMVTFKDALGISKTLNQYYYFLPGQETNITVKLGKHSDIIISCDDQFSDLDFTLGQVADIPASSGDSELPSVSNITLKKRKVYHHPGGAPDTYSSWTYCTDDDLDSLCVEVSYWAPSQFHGNNLGTTLKARTKLGTVTVEVEAAGLTITKSVDVYQQENKVESTVPAYTTTTGFSITLNPATVNSTASTSTVSGTRTYSSTTEKKTYTSGATSGGSTTTGLTQTITSGISVTASSMTGITSISGVTINVSANSSTTNNRTWTIYGTYDSKQGSATLTQLKSTSWGFDDDDQGDPQNPEEGNI